MEPEEFIEKYESALATQDWQSVSPFIHDDACVTFSNGEVYKGKDEVRKAFERNFSLIQEEQYSIYNIHWIRKTAHFAIYLFDFQWQGIIHGKQASGLGRGTSMLVCENGNWQLVAEHLGPKQQRPTT